MRVSTNFYVQRGLNNILDQQYKLAEVQEQIASGKRLNRPSDDPTGATQVLRLEQAMSTTDQFQRNSDYARNRLTLEEATLKNVQDSLLRVREIAVQGANSTLSDTDRYALAQEVSERLKELVGLANTRDANQEYLFAGYKVNTQPFTQASDGTYIYSGDHGERSLQISTGRQIQDSDAGNDVFMNLKNGNGAFQITANGANTGDTIINQGQVIDPASYSATPQDYTISFVTNGNGNVGYNVVGSVDGQIIPAPPLDATLDAPDYVSGATIQFNGVETGFNGTPQPGDSFAVTASTNESMFSSVQKLVTALEMPTASVGVNESEALNLINQSLVEIDNAFENITQVRTSVGARLKTIDDQVSVNESYKIELQSTLSNIRDVDIAEAAVELQSRLVALEAAQQSYARVQGLNLFDFI
ncbi:MAG: flagellar hook-associated protein FlgL [Gammaproteobacteria bacterium]